MDRQLACKAIDTFGIDYQISKAIEEMAELTCELARYKNNIGMNINVIEEIADVLITMTQMMEFFGSELVLGHVAIKERRLKKLIEDFSKVGENRQGG